MVKGNVLKNLVFPFAIFSIVYGYTLQHRDLIYAFVKLDSVLIKDCRLHTLASGTATPLIVGCRLVDDMDENVWLKIFALLFEINMSIFFRDLYINLYKYLVIQLHNLVELVFILA